MIQISQNAQIPSFILPNRIRICREYARAFFIPPRLLPPLLLRVGALSLGPKGIDHRLPTMETNRRFTQRLGCSCYEDNGHIVTKVALEGDTYGTLVKERQVDGSYRNQMMTIERNGDATVIELGSN